MGRAPCCEKVGLNRGPWTREEDLLLTQHISLHGEGSWRTLPKAAGLRRCGKSCRLRWINYLRPDLKRGNISEEEDQLIIKLHSLLGNRWSLIAGRLPGRTDNEIKNYWNTHLKKKLRNMGIDPQTHRPLAAHDQSCPCSQDPNNAAACTCQQLSEDVSSSSAVVSGSTKRVPQVREAFSYRKLLGMNPEQARSFSSDDAIKAPPSSPISILSHNSSLAERPFDLERSISSEFPSAARDMNFCELPRLSPTISDTATSSCSLMTKSPLSFEVYPVTVDWDSSKPESEELPPLFGEVQKQDQVPSGSLLLNIINSEGMWDVEIVRPIEELDPSMVITEAANTDLWESHYTSCVATGL